MNDTNNPKPDVLSTVFSKRYIISIIVIALVGSLTDDILIRYAVIPFWHVSDEYIDAIFGGLCTIAALGSAIQSIIIGAYSNKIFGFTVRELANFKACNVSISQTVSFSLVAVIIAIPCLAANFCTTVSMITVIVVIYTIRTSNQVWRLLTDPSYEKGLINAEVEIRGAEDPDYFLNGWFFELQSAITANDESLQSSYIEFIRGVVKKCTEKNASISNLLTKYLNSTFNEAVFQLGFVDTYKRVLCLDAPRTMMPADIERIIYRYVGTIKYCTASDIQKYQIAGTIDDIIQNLDADASTKTRYSLIYYHSVANNKIISDETRYQLIDSIIEKLCYLQDIGTGKIRSDVLLYIAKYGVFENDSDTDRQKIISIIVSRLFNENRYSRDTCYLSTVSQLFRGLYFYSIYEVETLSSEYRAELSKLYNYGDAGKNNFEATLSSLVNGFPEAVIRWLTNDAVSFSEQFDIFDYFPANYYFKDSIWTQDNLLHFAFFVYSIYGYHFSLFPAAETFLDNQIEDSKILFICKNIGALSDEKFKLNEQASAKIRELQSFLGTTEMLPEQYFIDNFRFFNEQLSFITTKLSQSALSTISADAQILFEELVPLLKNLEPFNFNSDIPLENGQHILFRPHLRTVEEQDTKYATQRKRVDVKEILNIIVSQTLPSEQIGFDLAGARILLNKLEQVEYTFRNYFYLNDLAISKETREAPEYSKLKTLITRIPFDQSRNLDNYVFLKQSTIEFNISIVDYRLDTPTDEQCEEYINGHKIADGKYRINGIIHDFDEAMKYVRENYRAESSEICIATNLTKDSGFKVT